MKTMDATDRKILNLIQTEFPITERPYAEIGRQVGIGEREAVERVQRLKREGYIRRIGPVLERKKLGYASALCGVHVEPEVLEEVAGAINAFPGTTHNYEREGELNLWFTVSAKTGEELERFLTDLEERYGLKVFRFPERRVFKIKTYFPV